MSDNAKDTDFDHGVVIFTKPNCVQCAATERRLQKAGVEYTAIDLSANPDLIEALRSRGFTAAPVVQGPDGDMYAGYNPDRLKAIITAMRSGNVNSPAESSNPMQSPPPQHVSTRNNGLRL